MTGFSSGSAGRDRTYDHSSKTDAFQLNATHRISVSYTRFGWLSRGNSLQSTSGRCLHIAYIGPTFGLEFLYFFLFFKQTGLLFCFE